MQGSRVSVLIVEAQPVVRWALRRYLEEQGMSAIGETCSAVEAVDLANIHEPDFVLMGLDPTDGSGIEATRILTRDHGRRVLAFSERDSPDQVEAFLAAGALGFVSKASPVKDLMTAIHATLDNRQWIPSQSAMLHQPGRSRKKDSPVLSSREREVAVLIAKGLSSSQVAAKLYVSLNTIETHRYRIFRKLSIHSRAELVEYVFRNALISH